MALYTATFSADASTKICDINRASDLPDWFANAGVSGTFGSGTMAFQISPDAGTTKYTLSQDGTATAASGTAAAVYNLRCGGQSNNNQPVALYATLTGSTNPTLKVFVWDNR